MLAQFIVSGLVVGCIYALVAVGFTVVYNATGTVNFAGGEALMLGAFFFLTFTKFAGLPAWLAFLLTLAGSAALGYLVFDRLVSRPLVDATLLSRVIALMGVASMLKGIARLVWGADAYNLPATFGIRPWRILGVRITPQEVAIVAATALILLALYAFFDFTRAGLAMRATAQNRRGAALMGVRVSRVFSLSWVIGTVLAGIGGVLLGPLLLVDPDMGSIGIKSFAAIVIGGFGSIPGAMLGGLLLGLVENLVAAYLRPEFQAAATFVLLIGVLAVKPTGLLGAARVRRV